MPVDAARVVYFTFQLIGLAVLPILTCTFLLCPSVKRHPTVPNNTFIYILSSLVSCLLLFSGRLDAAEPPRVLCQAQSALMLAQPSGISAAGLAMVWKVWYVIWNVRKNAVVPKEPLWHSFLLLGFPYVVWGVEAAIFAALQVNSRVHRVTFYCTSDNQSLGIVAGALAAILCILCLVFQAWAMILAYQQYRKSRRFGRAEMGDISFPFFARIMSFAFIVLIGLVLCFVATSVFSLIVPDIIVSSIGVLMFFIFASQEDVLVAWRIVRPKPCSSDPEATGTDVIDGRSIHDQPTLSLPSPSPQAPIFNLPLEPKSPHRTEMSPTESKFDGTIGDIKSIRTVSPPPPSHR